MSSKFSAALGMVLLSFSAMVAQAKPTPNDPIVLLLKGVYQPATNAPNLGLQFNNQPINLNDGSWSVTEIHTVTSIPGSTNQDNAVVGHFYVQFKGIWRPTICREARFS